uniref:C-type lectin domain-containing protein n=1 Tax=Fundulus heteroclitus TaxID=8078 RepID=A0A3Q2PGB0_FUNHE
MAVIKTQDQETKLLHGDCPVFWYNFNGRCYKYVATLMTWADAELYCLSQGANLVSIHSLQEESFVKMLISNFDPAQGITWIGLSDAQRDGTFFWSDGSKLSFTYWNADEPNNAGEPEPCVHTNWDTARKWNDKRCSDKYAFVCKARPACDSECRHLSLRF